MTRFSTSLLGRRLGGKATALLLALVCLGAWGQSGGTGGGMTGDGSQTSFDSANQRTLGLPEQQGANSANTGPVQIRGNQRNGNGNGNNGNPNDPQQNFDPLRPLSPRYLDRPGEFERFVQSLQAPDDAPIRRLGWELVTDAREMAQLGQNTGLSAPTVYDAQPTVPPDYLVRPGDEIALSIWGSVDADLRLTVDRSGRIVVPRVGAISVAGVRFADLRAAVDRRLAQTFRNYQSSVSMGQLRGVRVFVAGFARHPGSITVNSLSSVLHVLMRAGGPTAAGSFRDITLRRNGQIVGRFDLYDLLLKGDRAADLPVQADDVIHVGPVGPQVAILGSVNQPVIAELKPGEGVMDVLAMAGGFSAVADRSRVAVERLSDRSGASVIELRAPQWPTAAPLGAGDLVRVFSAVASAQPKEKRNKRVRIEGEVTRPGEYVLPPGSKVTDALKAAGGMTQAAFVFGTEFNREAVRVSQQENFNRALRDFETELAKSAAVQRGSSADEAATQTANARLVERLRLVRPTGRIVLQIAPDAQELPDLALEDGDRIHIPSKSSSIGVFGSVFNAGSFLFGDGRSLDDYVRLAGGLTRGAEAGSVFVIRANGSVISTRQGSSWFGSSGSFGALRAEAGDTIFVPEEINKTTFLQAAKDWTQVFYQFGLGVAAMKTIGL